MANLVTDIVASGTTARSTTRRPMHVDRAQRMLLAAGLTAFGIVAVAGAMLSVLF